jgi:hypothetical protein
VILREMVEAFYEEEVDIPDDPSLDYKWTPAEVNQILFRNFGNSKQAIHELATTTQNGFTESEDSLASFQNDSSTE